MTKKKLISEAFNIKNAQRKAKDGHVYQIAYIDPATSESTFKFKNDIQKFNCKFFPDLKAWGWFLGRDPQATYIDYIQPCLEWLTKVEDGGNGTRQNEVVNIINKLLQELNGEIQTINVPNAKNLSDALTQFKIDLMNCTSSEEFKKRMEPIIKAQQALGHSYSFANTLLIWFQDPEATMVKSPTAWAKMNRNVVDKTTRPIVLWRPDKEPLTPAQRKQIQANFLRQYGVDSVKELNPGQKEELRVQLNGGALKQNEDGRSKFKTYYAYDIRFTEQIEGKEDLVGDPSGKGDIQWFDDSTEQNEHLSACIQAGIEVIKDAGINVIYQSKEEMGGALGFARGDGTISLLADADPTPSFFNTLTHELSHMLLHIGYLKKSKGVNSEWAQFFVGTEKGRGMVEQQAEISAYIVLRFYGYDTLNSSSNYAGVWGMDEKSTCKTFDSVAQVASFIIKKIGEKLNKSNVDTQEDELNNEDNLE